MPCAALCDFGCALVSKPSELALRGYSGQGSVQYSAPEVAFVHALAKGTESAKCKPANALSPTSRLTTCHESTTWAESSLHLSCAQDSGSGALFSGKHTDEAKAVMQAGHNPLPSDVWSFGIMLFVVFTNRAPFDQATPATEMYRAFVRPTTANTLQDF